MRHKRMSRPKRAMHGDVVGISRATEPAWLRHRRSAFVAGRASGSVGDDGHAARAAHPGAGIVAGEPDRLLPSVIDGIRRLPVSPLPAACQVLDRQGERPRRASTVPASRWTSGAAR